MPVKKPKSKSKPEKKSTPSSKRKTNSTKKKKVKQTTKKKAAKKPAKKNKPKAEEVKVDKAEIKKVVDEIPNLLAKKMTYKKPEEAQEKDNLDFSEEELQELKGYFQPKKTFTLQYRPKKDKRTKLIWIGVFSIATVIFAMWIWNIWSMFYDVTEYKQEEKTAFWQNVRSDFNEAFESVKPEVGNNENNLQKAAEETEGKEKLEEVLGLLITELNTTTSTTSTIDMATSTATSTTAVKNTNSTLESIIEKLKSY